MGQIKKIIQEFILGGSIIYHSFTLIQQIWPLKKLPLFLEINGKWLIIQGVKPNLWSKIYRIFGHF